MPERWEHELRKLKGLEPPADLWDWVLRGPRREPPRMRRTWQVIAPIAAALAVAVVVVGTLALVQTFGPAPGSPGRVAGHRAGRFVDPLFGWSIRIPAGLRARHFQVGCLHGPVAGVRVTSFAPDLRAPSTGTPPMGWLRSFPADGVAVQIWYGCSLPFPPPLRDSAFPLSPSSFHRIRPYVGGQEPHPWYCGCYGDGISFVSAVWIGPHASRAEQQAAWAVVRSLRFPALREGTIYPAPRARRAYGLLYYVLGRASRYPVGSVTTFPASALPGSRAIAAHVPAGFYLIHAPRAFYVIPRLTQRPAKPFTKCTLAFDPKAFQFYCPGTDLRWNRVGQPIAARTGSGPDWNLPLVPATVAQDGHILFSPFWGDVLRVVLKGSPWG
jgi:hypothetical protein